EIQQLLDLGADGVMVPHVESAEEAAAIVRAARYPPDGARGIGGVVRAARYGLDADEYFEHANASIAVLGIVESGRGVQNAHEIAAVEGLDGIMIGPTDLTADLGFGGRTDHPQVREAIDRVVAAALAAGLKVGAPGGASEDTTGSQLVYAFND